MKHLLGALVQVFLVAGCLSSNGSDGVASDSRAAGREDPADVVIPLKALQLVDACVQTGAQACEECRAEGRSRVSSCFSSCTSIATSTGNSSCYKTCETLQGDCSVECGGDAKECRRRGYQFRAITEVNAAVREACEAAVFHLEQCDQPTNPSVCPITERTEREEAAEVYRCIAKTPCGQSSLNCLSTLPPSTVGQDAAALCPEANLSPKLVAELDEVGSWARDEVIEDLAVCAEVACDTLGFEYEDCLEAWAAMMQGKSGYY